MPVKCHILSILPKTYVSFGNQGYLTLEESLNKKVSYNNIKEGCGQLIGKNINYYFLKSNTKSNPDIFLQP